MPSLFFVEWILFWALPSALVLTFFQKSALVVNSITQAYNLPQHLLNKKRFFINLRFAQVVLLCCLFFTIQSCITFWEDSVLINNAVPLYNSVFFFRKDVLIEVVNTFFTFGGIYYLALVGFVFTKTKENIKYHDEIPFLLLATILSQRILLCTSDLLLVVLMLEIMAFCTILLICIQSLSKDDFLFPVESAIKYFLVNAIAIAIVLLALVFYFSVTNTLNVIDFQTFFLKYPFLIVFSLENLLFANFLFFFGFFIKIGAAPVHQWVPDVYEGAETIMTAFLVIIISPGILFKFVILFKMLSNIGGVPFFIETVFFLTGIFSIIIGTLSAFYQTKLKRFIAYAGLTHLGFMILALITNSLIGYFATLTYLLVYFLTNIAFFTLLLLAQQDALVLTQTKLIYMHQFKDIFFRSRFLFLVSVIIFFSFAGIPPFGGFFTKFFVFLTLLNEGYIATVLLLILFVIIGTYMYLRFLKQTVFENNKKYLLVFGTLRTKSYRGFWENSNSVYKNQSLQHTFLLPGLLLILVFLGGFIIFLPVFGTFVGYSTLIFCLTY
jgi:proton-translocating NADH-quinone oxidoreductase chain N